jgi:WD40 repeat protein
MKPAIIITIIALLIPFSLTAQAPEPVLRINTAMHTASVHKIDTDAAGKYILSCSSDKTARLWDASTGDMLRVFRPPIAAGDEGKLYACALSPDRSIAAVSGWTGKSWHGEYCMYIFNTSTGAMVRKIGGLEHVVFDCEFSPDGALLSACLGGGKGVVIVSTATWKMIKILENYGDASYNACFSGEQRLATVCDDGKIRLYDAEYQPIAEGGSTGSEPYGIVFSPDGKKCAVGYYGKKRLDVLDGKTLKPLYNPALKGLTADADVSSVCWSSDGSLLYAGGRYRIDEGGFWRHPVRMYTDGGRGSYTDYPVCHNMIFDLKALPDNSIAFGGAYPEIGRMDSRGNLLFHRQAEILDYSNYQYNYLRLSTDGSSVSFKPHGKGTFTFSINTRELREETSSFPLAKAQHEGLAVSNWLDSRKPLINGKECAFLEKNETCRSAAAARDGKSCVLGTNQHVYCANEKGVLLWKVTVPDHAWAVNIAEAHNVCIAACGDGTIRWFGLDDGKPLLTFFAHSAGKRWILFSASGYFDCSANADDLIGWHVNNGTDQAADFYPAGRFSSHYYRPDVLSLILEYCDEQKALEAADSLTGKETGGGELMEVLPPVISIVKPGPNTETEEKTITFTVSIRTPSKEPVTEIKLLLGGRPHTIIRSQHIVSTEGKELILSCDLEPGVNDITVCARNKHVWSEPACISIVYKGEKKTDTLLPQLYILAVGVSKYEDPELRLGFAAKDAKDFSTSMTGQKKKLYSDVSVTLLTDEKATKDNILDGLDWIQSETTSRDIAMIFFAGHGMNDNTGNLYYLPVDANLEKIKRTCLPSHDISLTIQAIAGKVIYFMDTCHSGNISVMGRRGILHLDTNKEVMELIQAEKGAVVFCSSSGNQYSLEKEQWGNGAFTLALVEGINGKADYIGEGTITINQLDLYISQRVKKLTGGRQTPVTAKPDTIRDFPIALVQ